MFVFERESVCMSGARVGVQRGRETVLSRLH